MKFLKKQKDNTKIKSITIDKLNYKKDSFTLSFIIESFLLCITLFGFLLCVSTSVNMPIAAWQLAVFSVVSMLVCSIISINKRVHIISVTTIFSFGVIALVFTKELFAKIIDAFEFCYNQTIAIIVEQGYRNYESSMTMDILPVLEDTALATNYYYTVIISLTIIFSLLFSLVFIKRFFVWFAVLPCFLVLTPSLYYGATPGLVAFSIFISGVLGCYIEILTSISQKKNKKDKNTNSFISSINGFSCTVVTLLLSLTVSLLLFSSDGIKIDSVRNVIDDIANKIMNTLFYENYETPKNALGGLLEGDYLELKTPKFRDLPVMNVKSQTNSPLYFRGWIAKDLYSEGWKVLGGDDTKEYKAAVGGNFDENLQFYNFTKIVSDNDIKDNSDANKTTKYGFVYDTIDFRVKFSKSLMIFTPVNCTDKAIDAEYEGISSVGDTILFFDGKRSKGNEYTYQAAVQDFSNREFYINLAKNQKNYLMLASEVLSNPVGLNSEKKFIFYERKYSEYVNKTYSSVPQGFDFLKTIANEVTADYSNDFAKVLSVERYFKQNYTYATKFTTVAGTPAQKIKYMVTESKTGFCTYFATAMTVMIRQLGLPARYVTGYYSKTVEENDESEYIRKLNDSNYHAWVEVYFDGIGWLTFDPTPGFLNSQSMRDYSYLDDSAPIDVSDIDDQAAGSNPATPVAPVGLSGTADNPDGEKAYTTDEEEEEEQEKEDEEKEKDKEDKKEKDDKETKYELPPVVKKAFVYLFIISLIITVAYLLILGANLLYNKFLFGLHKLTPNIMVCVLYGSILRLLSASGYNIKPGEMLCDFAKRVDDAFKINYSFKNIVDTLQESQFSQNIIDKERAEDVYNYYMFLSQTIFDRLNVFKRNYYKATMRNKINR